MSTTTANGWPSQGGTAAPTRSAGSRSSILSSTLFIIVLDNTILNVAVPTIIREFHTQVSSLQWVISGYSLVFASLLISFGRLGDIVGRRKMFFIGADAVRGRLADRVAVAVGRAAVHRRVADRGHRRGDDAAGHAVDHLGDVPRPRARRRVRGVGLGRRRRRRARPVDRRHPHHRLLVALGVPRSTW